MWSFWLLIITAILFIGTLPPFPHRRKWGYLPSVITGLVLLSLICAMWFGYIAFSWPWSAPAAPYPRP